MTLEYDILSPFEAPCFVYVPPGVHKTVLCPHTTFMILYDSYDKCFLYSFHCLAFVMEALCCL